MDRLLVINIVDKLCHYNAPIDSEYHPETDDTHILAGDDISNYIMLIGIVMRVVTLGQYDTMYNVDTL